MKKKEQGIDTIQGRLTKSTRSIAINLVFLTAFFTVFLILIIFIQYSMIRYSNKRSTCIAASEEANGIFRKIDDYVYGGDAFNGPYEFGAEFTELYDATKSEHGAVVGHIEEAKEQYEKFLTTAEEVVKKYATDQEAATDMCDTELYNSLEALRDILNLTSESYSTMESQANTICLSLMIFCIIVGVVLTLLSMRRAFRIGKNMSESIASPVTAVAGWAEGLAL